MLVVAGILLALVALLAVPLHVAFRAEGIEPLTGRLELGWLFGLVRFRVPARGGRKESAGAPPRKKKERKRGRREARGRRAQVLAVLRQAAFRERLYRLVKELVHAAHVRRLRLRMRLGLGDPADTGRLWAVVGPLSACVPSRHLRSADVWIEPDFAEPVLEFRAGGRLVVIPLQVLAVAVSFVLSPASIPAWRLLWSRRG